MKTKKQKKQNPKTCCVHIITMTCCSITLVLRIRKSITFSNQQEQLGYQNIVSTNLHQYYVWKLGVATPLWVRCEDETHTPKSGNLESSGTLENSELDYRG